MPRKSKKWAAKSYRVEKKSIQEKWLNAQDNQAKSLNFLIQLAVKSFGYEDITDLGLEKSTLMLSASPTPKINKQPVEPSFTKEASTSPIQTSEPQTQASKTVEKVEKQSEQTEAEKSQTEESADNSKKENKEKKTPTTYDPNQIFNGLGFGDMS